MLTDDPSSAIGEEATALTVVVETATDTSWPTELNSLLVTVALFFVTRVTVVVFAFLLRGGILKKTKRTRVGQSVVSQTPTRKTIRINFYNPLDGKVC